MVASKTLSLSLMLPALASARWIVPGARWRDTDGEIIHAHAGGVTRDEETGRFHWFGEYKIEGMEGMFTSRRAAGRTLTDMLPRGRRRLGVQLRRPGDLGEPRSGPEYVGPISQLRVRLTPFQSPRKATSLCPPT